MRRTPGPKRDDSSVKRIPQKYRNGVLVMVIDCSELRRSAQFWTEVLGYRACHAAMGRYLSLIPKDGKGVELLLQQVHDKKHGKNRLHLDLRPADQAAEVARLEALGARRVDVGQGTSVTWVVLADPEGNEFCVLRAYTEAERAG